MEAKKVLGLAAAPLLVCGLNLAAEAADGQSNIMCEEISSNASGKVSICLHGGDSKGLSVHFEGRISKEDEVMPNPLVMLHGDEGSRRILSFDKIESDNVSSEADKKMRDAFAQEFLKIAGDALNNSVLSPVISDKDGVTITGKSKDGKDIMVYGNIQKGEIYTAEFIGEIKMPVDAEKWTGKRVVIQDGKIFDHREGRIFQVEKRDFLVGKIRK